MPLFNTEMTNQSVMATTTESNKRNRSSFESEASDTNERVCHWAKTSYSFGDSFGFTEFVTSPARGEREELDGSSHHGKSYGDEDPMATVPSLSLVQHALNKTNDEEEEEEDYNEAELQPLFDKIQGVLKPKATGTLSSTFLPYPETHHFTYIPPHTHHLSHTSSSHTPSTTISHILTTLTMYDPIHEPLGS